MDMFEFRKKVITLEALCQATNKYMMNIYSSEGSNVASLIGMSYV